MTKINRLLLILILILLGSFTNIYGDSKENKDICNILLINSYDTEDQWESDVSKGLKETLKNNNINIKTEYLDSRNNNNIDYINNFQNLLNTKYKGSKFDIIITLDDEAFKVVKDNLFNPNSIFYKKIVVFTGVNERVHLTSKEKEYITGFVDGRSKIELIKLITNLQPQIKNINVLLDNTSYSKDIENKLLENRYLLDRDININFIHLKYEDEILSTIKTMDKNKDALLICGIFKDKDSYNYINPKDLIDNIKDINNLSIYTSREDYIDNGAIGGYVDIARENGKALGKMVLKIYEEKGISQVPLINKLGANYIVDYNEIYNYDIDLSNLPQETAIINKKDYELLLSKNDRVKFIIIMVAMFIGMLYIIIMMLKHKRNNIKNKNLYKITKDREQLKTDFIANMSHELRTPLNIIRSASTLLEIKANKDEVVKKEYILDKVERINQNSDRLIRLINNLIDITKFESGFYEFKYKNENIVYVVEDIVFETVDYANEKNIEMIFDTDAEEIISFIDKEKIERVILNLLSNAIKFTNENGKIEVYMKHDENFVYISIKDNGIGIPQEKINQIFHRFYQVDSILSRRSEGSGIGLCIVDEIIKMHKGKVNIYSEVNKGTTFEVVLNIAKDDNIEDDNMEDKTDKSLKDVVKVEMSNI